MSLKQIVLFLFLGLSAISLPFSYLPSRFEVVESAKASVTYNITLISNKSVTEEVDLSLSTWEVTSDQFLFYPFNEDWVFLPTSHMTIPPDSSQTFAFGVKVPDGVGERRFEVNLSTELENASFRFSKTIPIYLVISGTEIVKCRIVSFDILHKGDSLQVNCMIENEGNVHIRPRIDIQFSGDSNWIRVQDDVPVYPFSQRQLGNIISSPAKGKEGALVNVRVQYYDIQGSIYTVSDQVRVR